ncbi:type II toxin-antitoxin system VapC family toxin [Acidobacteriia bacterium AH_259_A11_L15]|nr:type II toxin-antitoxin system VapC family toxin [Acidobacteriia bacterium AH_259_A11_L15]
MVVIDSFGWIEYFTDGPKASAYARYLETPEEILTPALVTYEVYKKIKCERGEELANPCLSQLNKTEIIALDQPIALLAAALSLEFSLPMADALVLATARANGARLVTSDADFRNVPDVDVL